MKFEKSVSTLALHRTMVFESAEEREKTLRRYGINHEVRQLGKGKFRSDMAARSTERADLFSCRINKAVSMSLEPAVGMVAFLLARSSNGQYWASGENVANDKLVVLPNGSGTDIVTSSLAGIEAIVVPEARLTEMTEVLSPRQKSFRSDRMSVIEGDTAQLHKLRMAVLDLVCHPELEPSDERMSNLIVATLAWAGNSSSQWRPEGSCVNGARTRVAKLTQEVIEAQYKQPIRIEDLCRVTGVGIRTLQRSFRAYFDITITKYLGAVRLDAAYRELYATYPQQDTVTAIALRHGITHLGRFSVDFRQRFGESPSKLLATYADRKSHIRESSATTAYAAGPH